MKVLSPCNRGTVDYATPVIHFVPKHNRLNTSGPFNRVIVDMPFACPHEGHRDLKLPLKFTSIKVKFHSREFAYDWESSREGELLFGDGENMEFV